MDTSIQVIKCVGRRRLVVESTGETTLIHISLGDPPRGKHIATLELTAPERDKLLIVLVESKANVA